MLGLIEIGAQAIDNGVPPFKDPDTVRHKNGCFGQTCGDSADLTRIDGLVIAVDDGQDIHRVNLFCGTAHAAIPCSARAARNVWGSVK